MFLVLQASASTSGSGGVSAAATATASGAAILQTFNASLSGFVLSNLSANGLLALAQVCSGKPVCFGKAQKCVHLPCF